jgi:hypothetical protein
LPAKEARVFPQDIKQYKIIDATFDKLHGFSWMIFTNKQTPFSYPVFVVFKVNPDGKCSGQVVVDLHSLNQMILSDVYLLPSQSEMTSLISGSKFITVVDCAFFFYQ